MKNKYPIYIISKGRADTRLTSKALERMNCPYSIVIEQQEYDDYAAVISPDKILVLPFSNLGLGGIPARNWVFEHAISTGAERHWIMDDNIVNFGRLNHNTKKIITTATCFRVMEDFVDRYTNIAMAGPQYDYFLPRKTKVAPYTKNTRVYSCILLKNDITHRWRGRYNEDTDLSLRILKDGMCTILFNAFFQYKTPTMQMKGGNTDVLYNQGDNRMAFAKSLQEQHPDVCTIVERFGRNHHMVDYRAFKSNKMLLNPNVEIKDGVDDYGMILKDVPEYRKTRKP